jgi:uncharacterized protein (DUF2147 family)
MKRIVFFIGIFFLSLLTFAQADVIMGIWLTEGGESQVKIYKGQNGKYYGKIVWLEDKSKEDDLDNNNPNPKLRERKMLGLPIILGLSYNEEKKDWSDGLAYDPKSGKTYDCFIWFEDGDTETLYLKGFVLGMRFAGRTTEWIREPEIRE